MTLPFTDTTVAEDHADAPVIRSPIRMPPPPLKKLPRHRSRSQGGGDASVSLLKFVGQASLVDDAMLPS